MKEEGGWTGGRRSDSSLLPPMPLASRAAEGKNDGDLLLARLGLLGIGMTHAMYFSAGGRWNCAWNAVIAFKKGRVVFMHRGEKVYRILLFFDWLSYDD